MKKKSLLKRKSQNKEKNSSKLEGKKTDHMIIDEMRITPASHETIKKLVGLYQTNGYPLSSEIEPNQVPIVSIMQLHEQKKKEKEHLVNILDRLVNDLETHQMDLRRLEKEQQSFENLIQSLLDEDTAQKLIQETESKIQEEHSKAEALIK
ncbi:hypothetical protein O0R52_22380 (plasmid) [Bacillus halotolerans]|uniref:Uncharacterized protein n=1 Tax=Bacillus halotolerans TaxID=260554 RepID=A0ABY7I757_9BACI|nr:hypothetical protein [Bacillus halotolerans]WAT23532.1 hypothetical protein O0R52_22380 [Bacillus halotolerans]